MIGAVQGNVMFADMKIGTRLALGFGAVVLLLVIAVGVGVTYIGDLKTNIETVGLDKFPKTAMVNKWAAGLLQTKSHMRTILVNPDKAEVAKDISSIREYESAAQETQQQLVQVVKSEAGMAHLKTIAEIHGKYLIEQGEYLRLAEAGQLAAAKELLFGKLRPLQAEYVAALDKYVGYETERMQEETAVAVAHAKQSRTWLVALGITAVVLAAIIALLITRGLLALLGGEPAYAAGVMRDVAGGNLNIDVTTRRNDDSSMLYAVSQMVAKLRQVVDGQRRVVEAANRGKFDTRIDLTGLEGFQKDIGEGLNQLVTTIGASVDDVVRVMGPISAGDLSKTIDKHYEGTFGELKTYTNDTVGEFPGMNTLDRALTPLPANPVCWDVMLALADGDRYLIRHATWSLAPQWIPAQQCMQRDLFRNITAPISPMAEANTDTVLWHGEVIMTRAQIAALAAANCEVAAFMRFARMPWILQRDGRTVIGDLRYDREPGLGFAEIELGEKSGGCPALIPSWIPPRQELLQDVRKISTGITGNTG